jgi:hypothetical protein
VLSTPGMREGEEGVSDVEDVVKVAVTEEDDMVEVAIVEEEDDNDPVEVIPVIDPSPPRPAYKQTSRIQIGPQGQPTGAREAVQISPETGSEVWPPPPPPSSSASITAMTPSHHRK